MNKNRHNKRMMGSPTKDQIDLSFPELSANRKYNLGSIVITDSELPSKMNVQKDGFKIQNKRLSVRDFQVNAIKGSPSQKRYLDVSDGHITSSRAATI